MQVITKRFSFIIYPLLICVIVLGLPVSAQAQEENITVTTYYPAPYGVYKEMQITDKLMFEGGSEIWVKPSSGGSPIHAMTIQDDGDIVLHQDMLIDDAGIHKSLRRFMYEYNTLQTSAINQVQRDVDTIYKIAEEISGAMIFLGGHVYAAAVFALILANDLDENPIGPITNPDDEMWWEEYPEEDPPQNPVQDLIIE